MGACAGGRRWSHSEVVHDVVVPSLWSDKAREIVRVLRETGDLRRLVRRFGDGNNSHPLIRSMVHNNIRREGPVVLAPMTLGSALRKALAVSPVEVINDIKTSCLRGRRGAGFPTGMNQNLLGRNILGKRGFHFDIRIQMGAGACVCGEETAMISSCEGHRGDPKNRPPFPAQKGYLGMPTTANIVETFCCVARILDDGPGWFSEIGTRGSTGTTLLSVSGDCSGPGVYEVPFGIPLSELLTIVGAEDAGAVQVGGPSGRMVSRAEFHRTICYDDLATGGSAMSFGPNRNILKIALKFLDFFVEESCGYCTPCRVGNVLMKQKLEQIIEGRGQIGDLEHLQEHGTTMKLTSRCGLGQTAARPVLTTPSTPFAPCTRPCSGRGLRSHVWPPSTSVRPRRSLRSWRDAPPRSSQPEQRTATVSETITVDLRNCASWATPRQSIC